MSDSALPARKPISRYPQSGDIAAEKLNRQVADHLERLLFKGNPEGDYSDQIAAILRIPRATAEVLCNQHMATLARQHRTLKMGVQWALKESEELGCQMRQEFREDRQQAA